MSTSEQPEKPGIETDVVESDVVESDVVETDVVESDVVESDVVETDVVETDAAAPPSQPGRRRRWVAMLAAALLLGSVVAAGSVYWFLFRVDRLTDASAQEEVLAAARQGTEALLSYSPENLDQNLTDAKSYLTGQFLDYYSDFTEKVVAPAAKQKGVKTEANVARAAVSAMRPERAEVLVFVNQVTTSKERPTPALSTSSVMVTLVQAGDRWLISEFNPV